MPPPHELTKICEYRKRTSIFPCPLLSNQNIPRVCRIMLITISVFRRFRAKFSRKRLVIVWWQFFQCKSNDISPSTNKFCQMKNDLLPTPENAASHAWALMRCSARSKLAFFSEGRLWTSGNSFSTVNAERPSATKRFVTSSYKNTFHSHLCTCVEAHSVYLLFWNYYSELARIIGCITTMHAFFSLHKRKYLRMRPGIEGSRFGIGNCTYCVRSYIFLFVL